MQLSEKPKIFCAFLLTPKDLVTERHKGPVCKNHSAVNVLLSPKKCSTLQKTLLFYAFIILSQINFEKVIFNHFCDFRIAC